MKTGRTMRSVLYVLSVYGSLVSCKDDNLESQNASSHLKGYVEADGTVIPIWPAPHIIPVCWEKELPPGFPPELQMDPPAGYKERLQEVVTAQYARAGIHFTNWNDCQADSQGIRIFINNRGSGVNAFGVKLNGMPGGVYLNPLANYNINTALHEFGHAMGLHHEMNRRDNADLICPADQTYGRGTPGVTSLGDYDRESIMSYCRDSGKNELSNGDVRTLKAYHFGPVATLSGEPIKEDSRSSLNITVSGANVMQYRYKIGLASSMDCKLQASYSAPIAAGIPIRDDISHLEDGPVKLCVLAGNASGVWQDSEAYTSAYWIKVLDFKCLWPADEKLVDVPLAHTSEQCTIRQVVTKEYIGLSNPLIEVDSNPDYHASGSLLSVKLLAKREDLKSGRTYEIEVNCPDLTSGKSARTAIVRVPPHLRDGPTKQECEGRFVKQ